MRRQILRTRGLRTSFIVIPLLAAVSTLASHPSGPEHGGDALGIAATSVALCVYLAIMTLARTRVEVDADGVTVVNPVRRRRVRWSEVAGFGWGAFRGVNAMQPWEEPWSHRRELLWPSRAGLGVAPKTCLVLADGSVVPMFALACGGAGVGGSTKKAIETLEMAWRDATDGSPDP